MATPLLLHPFAVLVSGSLAVADQGSDDDITSQIAVAVGTRIGERPMCPPFGTPDPAFAELAVEDVQTCLDHYGPDGVEITSVVLLTGGPDDEFVSAVELDWERSA